MVAPLLSHAARKFFAIHGSLGVLSLFAGQSPYPSSPKCDDAKEFQLDFALDGFFGRNFGKKIIKTARVAGSC